MNERKFRSLIQDLKLRIEFEKNKPPYSTEGWELTRLENKLAKAEAYLKEFLQSEINAN